MAPCPLRDDVNRLGVAELRLSVGLTQRLIDAGVITVGGLCGAPTLLGIGASDWVQIHEACKNLNALAVLREREKSPQHKAEVEATRERSRRAAEEAEAHRRRSEEGERRRQAWHASGFYPRHKAAADTRLTWPRPELVEAAYLVLMNGGPVVLVGPRGVGKTQLSVCLARRVLADSGRDPWYMAAYDFFATIKQSFDGDGKDPRSKARTCGLLVLDEIQDRYDSAFEDLEMRRLFDHRYGHERPTVLISNLKAEEVGAILGVSMSDRIRENGLVVVCDWQSFRVKGRAST